MSPVAVEQRTGRVVLVYWGVALLAGVVLLGDWLFAWNVAQTWSHLWLAALLIITMVVSQVLYYIVARHGKRSLNWQTLWLFALGNGLCETLAFAVVYFLGERIGATTVGLFAPSFASIAGFALGLVFFIIYGGFIHALFWLRLLPPHLDDSPRSRRIRKLRPLAEVGLVLSWSLCFWLTRDIWTVVILHVLVDIGLVVRVRPQLFSNRPAVLSQRLQR